MSLRWEGSEKMEIISTKLRNCERKKMGVGKTTAICAVNLRYPSTQGRQGRYEGLKMLFKCSELTIFATSYQILLPTEILVIY